MLLQTYCHDAMQPCRVSGARTAASAAHTTRSTCGGGTRAPPTASAMPATATAAPMAAHRGLTCWCGGSAKGGAGAAGQRSSLLVCAVLGMECNAVVLVERRMHMDVAAVTWDLALKPRTRASAACSFLLTSVQVAGAGASAGRAAALLLPLRPASSRWAERRLCRAIAEGACARLLLLNAARAPCRLVSSHLHCHPASLPHLHRPRAALHLPCCRGDGDPQVPAPADAGTLVRHLPPPRLVRLASVSQLSLSSVDWAVLHTLALPRCGAPTAPTCATACRRNGGSMRPPERLTGEQAPRLASAASHDLTAWANAQAVRGGGCWLRDAMPWRQNGGPAQNVHPAALSRTALLF